MDNIKIFFKKVGLYVKSLFVSVENEQPRLKTLANSKGFESLSASVISAFLGLVVGVVVMLIVNPPQAFAGFGKLLLGGFTGGTRGVGNVLYIATPILMTGLSVGFAFKTGLFNIGATGQYTMGIFCSLMTAHFLGGGWVLCILAGMLGGMLWGFIPGIFKALLNVNEVITSIMTNYIGMYFIDMMITSVDAVKSVVYNNNYARTYVLPDKANLPKFGLDVIFPRSNANAGIIIAIVIAVVVYIILNKTTFGYELKACGLNKHAAKYAGVSQNRNVILSMVIAGGLAGIGGALQIQAGAGNFYAPHNVLEANGFNGIAVALLGTSNPIGIILAALFFAHLQQGGLSMQSLGFSADIIDIIIGVIIYFSAFALIIKSLIPNIISKIKKNKKRDTVIESADTDQMQTKEEK